MTKQISVQKYLHDSNCPYLFLKKLQSTNVQNNKAEINVVFLNNST
jgi:hypothetical protein